MLPSTVAVWTSFQYIWDKLTVGIPKGGPYHSWHPSGEDLYRGTSSPLSLPLSQTWLVFILLWLQSSVHSCAALCTTGQLPFPQNTASFKEFLKCLYFLFVKDFIFIFNFMHTCVCLRWSEEGVRFPGEIVTGSCELSCVGAGNEFGSSGRRANTLSPEPALHSPCLSMMCLHIGETARFLTFSHIERSIPFTPLGRILQLTAPEWTT